MQVARCKWWRTVDEREARVIDERLARLADEREARHLARGGGGGGGERGARGAAAGRLHLLRRQEEVLQVRVDGRVARELRTHVWRRRGRFAATRQA